MPVPGGPPEDGGRGNPWAARVYPRGDSAFDRVVMFTDAVFAIALTLVAIEIGVPALRDGGSADELWHALLDKWPALAAFAFTFYWVAFYWRANHRFTATLRAMDGAYILTVLVYLAFIALLPFPASVFGEYSSNPVAIAFFALWVATVSTMETVLVIIAQRHDLYSRPLTRGEFAGVVMRSMNPVVGALLLAGLVFVSPWVGLAAFVGVLVAGGIVGHRFDDPAHPRAFAADEVPRPGRS